MLPDLITGISDLSPQHCFTSRTPREYRLVEVRNLEFFKSVSPPSKTVKLIARRGLKVVEEF